MHPLLFGVAGVWLFVFGAFAHTPLSLVGIHATTRGLIPGPRCKEDCTFQELSHFNLLPGAGLGCVNLRPGKIHLWQGFLEALFSAHARTFTREEFNVHQTLISAADFHSLV